MPVDFPVLVFFVDSLASLEVVLVALLVLVELGSLWSVVLLDIRILWASVGLVKARALVLGAIGTLILVGNRCLELR